MPDGNVTAFFMFDVGDAIDLPQLAGRVDRTVASRLATKPPTPIYLQYQQPPLTFDAGALGVGDVNGFPVRVKAFDYGVLSLAVTRPLPESWDEAFTAGLEWQDNAELAQAAERLCREMLSRILATVARPRDNFLSEDYVVFTVHPESDSATAEQLLALRGGQIAQLLRAERTPLSAQEHEEVLRHRISYYQTDVVIPTWSSAFVYDTGAGAAGVLEILEFANSQLLEFRYYDQLLDVELARTYAALQRGGWQQTWLGRHHARAARQIHAIFIDVNELTDRAENALKIAGDVYAARIFGLAAARLGLDQWKGNVREKLKTVDDIYRFTVERTSMARGEFLELTIVLLIILELILLTH